jgi:hypothetical protein
MRRLGIGHRRVNVEKELQSLRRWTDDFAGWFPSMSECRSGTSSIWWKIPIDGLITRPPRVTPAIQAACMQAIIDAAAHLAQAKPKDIPGVHVAAMFSYPDLFGSEVYVSFDEAEFRGHTGSRDSISQRWTPLPPRRSVVREIGLALPEGFTEWGYHQIERDTDESGMIFDAFEGEVWFIGDLPL